jgi:predicted phage-related endonuclease
MITAEQPDSSVVDRNSIIGGSDVAAVLGVSKWMTPYDLWLKKTGQFSEVITPAKQRIFDRGHRWEPIALDMLLDELEDRNGVRPTLLAKNKRYSDPEHPFLSCEIDAEAEIDGEHCNLELKSVHVFAAAEWGAMGEEGELTAEIPIHYEAQTQYGLGITGRNRCIVGALFGADQLVPYEVLADAETIAGMRAKAIAFWNHNVLGGIAPDPVNLEDVKRMYARYRGKPVELSEEAAQALSGLEVCRGRIKQAEQDINELQWRIARCVALQWGADIIERISNGVSLPDLSVKDNAILNYAGAQVGSWNRQRGANLDQKRLKEERPEIVSAYTREYQYRVFRKKKEK